MSQSLIFRSWNPAPQVLPSAVNATDLTCIHASPLIVVSVPPSPTAHRRQGLAVPAEGQGFDLPFVAGERVPELPRSHVPQVDRVKPRRGQRLSVGAEGHACDRGGVGLQGGGVLPRANVPKLDLVLGRPLAGRDDRTTRRKGLAIRAEGHGQDAAEVPPEGCYVLSGPHVPQPDRFVVAPGGQGFAAGAEGHAINQTAVPLQDRDVLRYANVPKPNGGGLGSAPGHGDSFPGRADCQRPDESRLAPEPGGQL